MNVVRNLLERSWAYKVSQWLWYKPGQQEDYVRSWIRARPGDRILDIGCGPATLLRFLPDVIYSGYDPNPFYIKDAQKRFASRGRFTCGVLAHLEPDQAGAFDLVLANGVMHHLSDEEVGQMLRLASSALRPGGRIVTRDGCYEPEQSALVRYLLHADRGKFVRTRQEYETLLGQFFRLTRTEVQRHTLRLPYSLLHCEGVKEVHR